MPPITPPPRLAEVTHRAQRRRWMWWAGAGLAVALGVLFVFNPATHGFYPRCLLHQWTGLECPGCGGLRAVHQLLRGNVAAAFALNPLVVLAPPLVAVGWLWRRRRGPVNRPTRVTIIGTWLLVALLLGFGVVRNLPFWRAWFAP